MRIFNVEKTEELNEQNIDTELGYIKRDRIFIAHHEAIEAVAEKGHYEVIKEYESGGRDVKWVIDTPAVEAKEAYDEYEDIQVFVPYTSSELSERRLNRLRIERKPLLEAFDKWEKAVLRGRAEDDAEIMNWYRDILDLRAEAFENVPETVRYYL